MGFKNVINNLMYGSRVESVREYEISFDSLLSELKVKGVLERLDVDNSNKRLIIRVRF